MRPYVVLTDTEASMVLSDLGIRKDYAVIDIHKAARLFNCWLANYGHTGVFTATTVAACILVLDRPK